MLKQWELRETDTQAATALASDISMHPLIAQILVARGIIRPDEARQFLVPSFSEMLDPYLLLGMDAAVSRLLTARGNHESVCIYGDYDVD